MTGAPLVSIITPSLNQASFLEQTLKSVHSQDYPHLEHIVIDGGSTDGSLEIIRAHEGRIASWVSEPDQGQSDAINKGFARARGEVVAWLNSDDLYYPGAVSRAMARFAADPKLDIVYGDGALITSDGAFLGYMHQVEPFNRHRLLSCYNYISQPTTFFRRATLERLGWLDTGLNYIMDWDLWCRLADAGCKFRYEPSLLAADRQYPATKTRSGGEKRLAEIRALGRRYGRSWLPHGYFAYAASYYRASRREALGAARMAALAKEGLYSVLNLRNLYFQARRPSQVRGVFAGLKGRGLSSARVLGLGPRAEIIQPLYRQAERLRLGLAASRALKGVVSLSQGPEARVELSPGRPEVELVLELPPAVLDSHQLAVTIAWDNAGAASRPVASLTCFELI